MKNTKNFIIGALLIVILAMAIGYSTFASQLSFNGTAQIIGEWNVKIINIEAENISEGCDYGKPEYTNTSATFNAKLLKPGDSITYVITIQNAGTIDATLDNMTCKEEENGSEAIICTNTRPADILKAGEQTTFTVKVEYDVNTTEVPTIKTKTITGLVEYIQL